MPNRKLLLAASVALLAGCTTWPTQHNGLTTDMIVARIEAAQRGLPMRQPFPSECSAVRARAGKTAAPSESTDYIASYWDACLEKIEGIERWGRDQRARSASIEAAVKASDAADKEARQARLDTHGPEFVDLYSRAYTAGIQYANDIYKEHGKVDISPATLIKWCSAGVCQLGSPAPGGMASEPDGFMMVSGIYAEPGAQLSQFKFVRFQPYGHGPYQRIIAVFTNK